MPDTIVSVVIAYALGSLPAAFLAGRTFHGIDIRYVGSRNVGALNAYRQLGPVLGTMVLLVDTGKGVAAIYIARWLGVADAALLLPAVAASAGHNWPILLRFKGGRGVAVVLGISFAVVPLLAAVTFFSTVTLIWLTRRPVLAITIGFLLLNLLTVATLQPIDQIGMCLVLTVLVTGTYFMRMGRKLLPAARKRDWRQLITIE